MRLADDARLVADNAHAFTFDKWQVVFELGGGTDIVVLIDESKGCIFFDGSLGQFEVLLYLGMTLR